MVKKLLPVLISSILIASTFVVCGCSPSTLTILSITEGDVSVMKAGTDSWIEGEVGMSLEAGDTIRVGGGSNAEITFSEGSTVELQAGTEIEIASLDIPTGTGSATIILEQTIGSVIFRVTKVVDPASRYEIETPTGVVAVRGSAMQVYVTEDGTTWAINLEGDIRAEAQGVELQIPEGRQCIIRPDQPPELTPEVTFADPNLEAAIREAIGKPTGDIYPSDLEDLTSLVAQERSIADLAGLEYATSLTYLDVRYNQVSDISPLANLTSLTGLGVSGHSIADVASVVDLTKLTKLGLTDSQIGDISPLSSLTNLVVLWLENDQISDISPLVDNEGLSEGDEVYLTGNPLSTDSINTYIPQLEARGVIVEY